MNNETVFGIFRTDKEIKDNMLAFLKNNLEDFRACENEFDISISNLKNSLTTDKVDTLHKLISTMYEKMIAEIKYEVILGLKANYEYFKAPTTNDFLESDMEIYTKEKSLYSLPVCVAAQKEIAELNKTLEIDNEEFYDGIREYYIYLDTVCPKLSHFFGYLIANQMLAEIIPGYSPNFEHTMKYTSLLEEYFGCILNVSELCLHDITDLKGE